MNRFIAGFPPYQMINILTGLVIILIFAYSSVFSTGKGYYPVECAHVAIYGEECPTCGLSHSFSEMVRGNISSAREYNRNGPLLFFFFAIQIFMRVVAGIVLHLLNRTGTLLIYHKALVFSDAILSSLLFIICFRNLLVFWQ